jgi:hypothetical protein
MTYLMPINTSGGRLRHNVRVKNNRPFAGRLRWERLIKRCDPVSSLFFFLVKVFLGILTGRSFDFPISLASALQSFRHLCLLGQLLLGLANPMGALMISACRHILPP